MWGWAKTWITMVTTVVAMGGMNTAVAQTAVSQARQMPQLAPTAPASQPLPLPSDASATVRAVVSHVLQQNDNHGRPWAVVDKQQARLYVFDADNRLVGATAALLGLAKGDDSAPGVAAKAVSFIPPHERTTPAGRFVSTPGRNLKGEAIVWVDYSAAVAIHRLRPTDPAERRPQRLESATPDDNRISLGCVVISGAFYDSVVAPLLGRGQAVVYVIPETRSWQTMFVPPVGASEAL